MKEGFGLYTDWESGGWRFWTWRAWDCVEIDEQEEARRGARHVQHGGLPCKD